MNGVRGFFVGAAKIATAITVAIIALGLLGWGIYAFSQYRESQANAPLADPRKWPDLQFSSAADVSLATLWRDGQMSYQFHVRGDSRAIEKSRASGQPGQFILTFLDEHGFKLFDHKVGVKEMTGIVDDKGKPMSFDMRGDTYADSYRRAQRWEISWTFPITKVRQPRDLLDFQTPRAAGKGNK